MDLCLARPSRGVGVSHRPGARMITPAQATPGALVTFRHPGYSWTALPPRIMGHAYYPGDVCIIVHTDVSGHVYDSHYTYIDSLYVGIVASTVMATVMGHYVFIVTEQGMGWINSTFIKVITP